MNTATIGILLLLVSNTAIPTEGNANIASVWKKVIDGADLVGYNRFVKTYRKSGGMKQAVKDFQDMKPRNIKTLDDGAKHGKVGNADVYLEKLPIMIVIEGKRLARKRVIMYRQN